jgi:hypothetical protein
MYLRACNHGTVEYPVTFQEVLRAVIEKRVSKHGREAAAKLLDMTPANLDYLRKGFRTQKDKKTGKVKQMRSYITFEHLEVLAKSEGVTLEELIKEVFVATAALESAARADLEKAAAINGAKRDAPPKTTR